MPLWAFPFALAGGGVAFLIMPGRMLASMGGQTTAVTFIALARRLDRHSSGG